MKIALAQVKLRSSKEANLNSALKMIEKAKGADMVLLPEMLMGGRHGGAELYDLAEDVEKGDFASALADAAEEFKTDVCTCLWETGTADRVYNTAVVYGADGSIKAKYRKLHLFDALSVKESDHMIPGDELPPVFECAGVKCGLSICYDLRFPEVYRSMVQRGAEVLLTPAAWYAGEMKVYHLHTLLAARAIENTSYALCANLCGGTFSGFSTAFAPFGEALGSLQEEEGLLEIKIDPERTAHVRDVLPCLKNFRKDIFM